MKRHERTFESYKRNHKGKDFEEAEKTKIGKEKNQIIKLEKKAKNLANKASISLDDDELTDEIEAIYHQSKKVAGNRNSHKTRLSELQKNDDFI